MSEGRKEFKRHTTLLVQRRWRDVQLLLQKIHDVMNLIHGNPYRLLAETSDLGLADPPWWQPAG